MCLRPVRIGVDTYPCGKCVECMRKKQLDYAQILSFQANRKHSAHFVTFTYDDTTLPIRCCDMRTGDLYYLQSSRSFDDDFRTEHALRDLYLSYCKPKFTHYVSPSTNFRLCASLNRVDFRLWLKRVRVYYERQFNKKLPAFTYFCVGEYGEKSYRPHYHALFFGLDDDCLNFMAKNWRDKFGFCLVKTLPSYSDKDIVRCSMYVSKYMNKGCNDCPELFLKDSLMEKPRVMCSSGMSVREGLRQLFTLDGKLDMFSSMYSVEDLQRVLSRANFSFGGKDFRIGQHFYKAALSIPNEVIHHRLEKMSFGVKHFVTSECNSTFKAFMPDSSSKYVYITEEFHELSSSKFKASPLQVALSYVSRALASKRNSEKLGELVFTYYSSEDFAESFGSFEAFRSSLQTSEEKIKDYQFKQKLSKSVF